LSIFIAILVFGIIILVHEIGHFFAARKSGVHVEEFAIGMGPKLFSVTKKGTVYSLRIIPLGGFCKMLGEDADNFDSRSFNSKTVGQRAFILSMGVVLNLVLAFVLFTLLAISFGYTSTEITGFAEGSNAEISGLLPGDVITRAGNTRVNISNDLILTLNENMSRPIEIQAKRGRETVSATLAPTPRYVLGVSLRMEQGFPTTEILDFTPNGSAENAGLLVGDIIIQVGNFPITTNADIAAALVENGNNPVEVQVIRDGDVFTTVVSPSSGYSWGLNFKEYGGISGTAGASFGNIFGYIANGFWQIVFWVKLTIVGVIRLFSFSLPADEIGGPIMIVAAMSGVYTESISQGIVSVIRIMAMYMAILSANLGVMNLLPLPALDGGRLVFLGIEKIRRKPISPEREGLVHLIGFAALICFGIFIAFKDIINVL
jgi:regulator of sigma E protease